MSDSTAESAGALVLSRSSRMAWLVCLSAALFFFYEFFQLNLFDVINESLRIDFQLDAAQLSWMSSTYLWANILFLLPAGMLLDRFSTRRVILGSMMICITGTIGFALTQSFMIAAFCHFLSGIGNAFCFLACVVLVTRWFPASRRAFVIGCVVTFAFMGGLTAHTPLAYLNAHYGWREALLMDGGIGGVLFLWILFTVKDYPADYQDLKFTQSKPSFKRALANRQNWLAGLYTACLNLPLMVLCALWGASYLEVAHEVPKISASNIVSLIFIGSIVGSPLAGWLSDVLGRRKPLMIWGALATLVVLMPLFMGRIFSEPMLQVLFFSLGFFTSAQVITYPMVAESNQASNTGAATGVASVVIMSGACIAQVLFGYLIRHHSETTIYTAADFQFAMWMFPVATLLGIFCVLLTKETYCKRLD